MGDQPAFGLGEQRGEVAQSAPLSGELVAGIGREDGVTFAIHAEEHELEALRQLIDAEHPRTLAGFVEPGESLEDAVAREVMEEAGIAIDGCEYHSSQPWPFPSSIMLGFWARWAGGEPAVRDEELEDVGWFTREAIVGGDVLLPPPTAIARRLIDEWLGDDEAPDAAGGLAV